MSFCPAGCSTCINLFGARGFLYFWKVVRFTLIFWAKNIFINNKLHEKLFFNKLCFRTFFPHARLWSDWVEYWKAPLLCRQCSWDKYSPHLQACHVGLWAGSHGGSLVQDKALGAGRHCMPCSPLLGATSSGCLLTWTTRTPLEGNATQLPLNSLLRHTYSGLSVSTWLDQAYGCINNQSNSCSSPLMLPVWKRSDTSWKKKQKHPYCIY